MVQANAMKMTKRIDVLYGEGNLHVVEARLSSRFDETTGNIFKTIAILYCHINVHYCTRNYFRTIHLKCMKQVCEEVMVLHLGSLEYMHYVLNIRFYGLKEFHKRYYIRDIIFYVSTLI